MNGKIKWHNLNIEAKRGNKRRAEDAMAKLVLQYNSNPDGFEKIAFTDYIEKWLLNVKNHIDIVTYEGYIQYAEKHIIPYFEDKGLALQDVKIQDIEEYYNYKSVGGRLDGKPGGLSARTIKLHKVVRSLVFKKAIHDGILSSNLCEYAKIPKIEKTTFNAKFYTVGQCKVLLQSVVGTVLHDMIYITMLYGLRRSELMGLRWNAVDFNKNTIAIKHTVVVQSTVIAKDKTKNNASMRIYPLLTDVKEISEWLGHADIGTTMNIYGHIDMEHKKELGNTLNELFA